MPHRFRGKDGILSGPAGGIVGMARTAAEAGFDHVIGFDMGGTSTDVSHFAGRYERTSERVVAGARVRAPMLEIHTVAAGGGSICHFDGARFRVGPDSAGAVPGPACYRRGGPLTITDCNLMLGKIRPEHFPALFGPDGDQPIDAEIVRSKFAALAAEAGMTPEAVARGFVRIAVDNMANAIKQISIARGRDVTRYALACFGGAGGQHACLVADALGMRTVIVHPLAGVLSAYGIGLADTIELRQRTFGKPLGVAADADLAAVLDELESEAMAALEAQHVDGDVEIHRRAALRYDGSDSSLDVAVAGPSEMHAQFEMLHLARFGFESPEQAVIVETAIVEAIMSSPRFRGKGDHPKGGGGVASAPITPPPCCAWSPSPSNGGEDMQVIDRAFLGTGAAIRGPATIVDPSSPPSSNRAGPPGSIPSATSSSPAPMLRTSPRSPPRPIR